jgi:hypothetical protein
MLIELRLLRTLIALTRQQRRILYKKPLFPGAECHIANNMP